MELSKAYQEIKNIVYLFIHPVENSRKISEGNNKEKDLEGDILDLGSKIGELVGRNGDLYSRVCELTNENEDLHERVEDFAEYVGETEMTLDKRNKLIKQQRGVMYRGGKKINALRNQLAEANENLKVVHSGFKGLFHTKKYDEKLQRHYGTMTANLIVKFGLSSEEINEIRDEEGHKGLAKKYLDLLFERRKEKGQKSGFIDFGKMSKKDIRAMNEETEARDYSEKKELISNIVGSVIDDKSKKK